MCMNVLSFKEPGNALISGVLLITGGGIGYVACCSVASGSSLSLAPCKRSLKTSFVVEREILVITTALGEQRQPPSSNSPPPPLDV